VISATDAALEGGARHFKSALRHRLGVGDIRLLPLREHPEDIGELLLYFLIAAANEARRPELLLDGHSTAQQVAAWADLFYRFVCYRWPGNVRQMLNFSRQVIMASSQFLTLTDNINSALTDDVDHVPAAPAVPDKAVRRRMRDVDEQEFDRALEENYFVAAAAAQQLGVSRTALNRRITKSARHRRAGEVPLEELQQALAHHHGDSAATALQLRVSQVSLRTRLRGLKLDWH
jgi:transcriptional regulator with PAS, ATPase and Fis domain